jgi:hypothetical protein
MSVHRFLSSARLPATALALAAFAGAASPAMAEDYIPTNADMMSINRAVHLYMEGLEKGDHKSMAQAFTEDGVFEIDDDRGTVVKMVGRDQIENQNMGAPPAGAQGAGRQGGGQGAPQGAGPQGAPPQGAGPGAPPQGAPPQGGAPQGAPPQGGQGAASAGGQGGANGGIWHFVADDYYVFDSPTHMTHYAYWQDVHPNFETRTSTLGIPGHYDDIFVKVKGQWLFKQRKVVVGKK